MKITLEKAISLSQELASLIERDFKPDIIIGIKEGGILPSVEIGRIFNKSVEFIKIGRVEAQILEEEYKTATTERKEEIKSNFDQVWFNTTPHLLTNLNKSLENKKVLLIDDAVHFGKTMEIAKKYLQSLNPNIIKIATLYYVDEYKPDYFLGKEENNYPWSTWTKYEPEYNKYKEYLDTNNSVY